jgi:hypothetical protein
VLRSLRFDFTEPTSNDLEQTSYRPVCAGCARAIIGHKPHAGYSKARWQRDLANRQAMTRKDTLETCINVLRQVRIDHHSKFELPP